MLSFRRSTLVVCLLVSLTVGTWSMACADEPVATNFEILKTMIVEISDELISGFPADVANRDLVLAPAARDERYEFLTRNFTGSLTAEGFRVHEQVIENPADTTEAKNSSIYRAAGTSDLNVEFQIIDFDLRYTKIYRSFLIGGKKVKRSADIRVTVRLVDPSDGLIVWVGEAFRSHDDGFPYGEIDDVEAGLYSFTKPSRETKKWGRIAEPVVVTGIIVGLIYLFFSNQSGD
jgi:hypothetical protein